MLFIFARFIYRFIGLVIGVFSVHFTVDVQSSNAVATNSAFECHPIRTLDELLNIRNTPIPWHSLVDPFDPKVRSRPRSLGADFENFDSTDELDDVTVTNLPDENDDEVGRPKVLVCHDLAGNYRDDRFVNGSVKWDDYRFYHWSGIDYFCYFSHSFVTLPTLGWLQAAHRHGVRVLGTVIFEPPTGSTILQTILASDATVDATVAALVHLARHCRFEGWLLNVECSLPVARVPALQRFVRTLSQQMHASVPHAFVIWYDSILIDGRLVWQNELNEHNRAFFDACDGILLNYNWTDKHLGRTAHMQLLGDRASVARVFVGIDVFGRGQVAEFRTHETWARIRRAHRNFSVGVFAPGWTFERASDQGVNIHTRRGTDVCNDHFVERDQRLWERVWPLLRSAGPSRLPFRSGFCLGSGKQRHRDGVLCEPPQGWFNLARQAWQPSVASAAWRLHFAEAFAGGSCLQVQRSIDVKRLFVVDWGEADLRDGVVVSYAYKSLFDGKDIAIWLRLRQLQRLGAGADVWSQCRLECGWSDAEEEQEKMVVRSGGGGELGELPDRQNAQAIRLRPLVGQELQYALISIAERGERSLPLAVPQTTDETEADPSKPSSSLRQPIAASINGWQVRYYYFRFDDGTDFADTVRITDVGVRCADTVYLGALHVHRGAARLQRLNAQQRQHGATITASDFK